MLKDMKLTAAEAKNETSLTADTPDYPWGLCVDLNKDSLTKLGMTSLPDVGTTMTMTAQVKVTSVSAYDTTTGSSASVSLQITAMDLDQPSTPNQVADKLFGNKQ